MGEVGGVTGDRDGAGGSVQTLEANGQPGAVTYDHDGRVVNVIRLDIAEGEVQAIRCVVNPDQLRHLGRVSALAREVPPGR